MNINPITIEEICGVNPPGVQYVNPGNNPNFVFTPDVNFEVIPCLLYTSPSPRDAHESRMPSSA